MGDAASTQSKNNQTRKTKHKGSRWVGIRWGGDGEHLLTRLACFVLQAKGKKQQKMEAKQIIRQLLGKQKQTNKKSQQSGMQKAQGSLLVLNSKELVLSR